MKKQIISILSAAMLMQGLPTVSSAEATNTEWWEVKDNINISFIGGSNTVSHHPNGWVQKTAENIKEKTGVEKVTVNNAGYGGTGSNFGVYRLENDVIKTDPDIVFIEFAGNDRMDMWRETTEDLTTGLPAGKEFDTIYKVSDGSEIDATETGGESYYIYNNVSVGRYLTESDGRTFHYANHQLTEEELNGVGTTKVEKKTFTYNKAGADSVKRNADQLVIDLIEMENPPAICFVYTAYAKYTDDGRRVLPMHATTEYNEIAEKYGIHVIDWQGWADATWDHTQEVNPSSAYYDLKTRNGVVHHNITGAQFFADKIKAEHLDIPESLEEILKRDRVLPEDCISDCDTYYLNPHIMPYTEGTYSTYKYGDADIPEFNLSSGWRGNGVSTERKGAKATFEFTGNTYGTLMAKPAGYAGSEMCYKMTVTDKATGEVKIQKDMNYYSSTSMVIKSYTNAAELEDGKEYILTLENISDKYPMNICGIFTEQEIPEDGYKTEEEVAEQFKTGSYNYDVSLSFDGEGTAPTDEFQQVFSVDAGVTESFVEGALKLTRKDATVNGITHTLPVAVNDDIVKVSFKMKSTGKVYSRLFVNGIDDTTFFSSVKDAGGTQGTNCYVVKPIVGSINDWVYPQNASGVKYSKPVDTWQKITIEYSLKDGTRRYFIDDVEVYYDKENSMRNIPKGPEKFSSFNISFSTQDVANQNTMMIDDFSITSRKRELQTELNNIISSENPSLDNINETYNEVKYYKELGYEFENVDKLLEKIKELKGYNADFNNGGVAADYGIEVIGSTAVETAIVDGKLTVTSKGGTDFRGDGIKVNLPVKATEDVIKVSYKLKKNNNINAVMKIDGRDRLAMFHNSNNRKLYLSNQSAANCDSNGTKINGGTWDPFAGKEAELSLIYDLKNAKVKVLVDGVEVSGWTVSNVSEISNISYTLAPFTAGETVSVVFDDISVTSVIDTIQKDINNLIAAENPLAGKLKETYDEVLAYQELGYKFENIDKLLVAIERAKNVKLDFNNGGTIADYGIEKIGGSAIETAIVDGKLVVTSNAGTGLRADGIKISLPETRSDDLIKVSYKLKKNNDINGVMKIDGRDRLVMFHNSGDRKFGIAAQDGTDCKNDGTLTRIMKKGTQNYKTYDPFAGEEAELSLIYDLKNATVRVLVNGEDSDYLEGGIQVSKINTSNITDSNVKEISNISITFAPFTAGATASITLDDISIVSVIDEINAKIDGLSTEATDENINTAVELKNEIDGYVANGYEKSEFVNYEKLEALVSNYIIYADENEDNTKAAENTSGVGYFTEYTTGNKKANADFHNFERLENGGYNNKGFLRTGTNPDYFSMFTHLYWKWNIVDAGTYNIDFYNITTGNDYRVKVEVKDKNGVRTFVTKAEEKGFERLVEAGIDSAFTFTGDGTEYVKISFADDIIGESSAVVRYLCIDSIRLKKTSEADYEIEKATVKNVLEEKLASYDSEKEPIEQNDLYLEISKLLKNAIGMGIDADTISGIEKYKGTEYVRLINYATLVSGYENTTANSVPYYSRVLIKNENVLESATCAVAAASYNNGEYVNVDTVSKTIPAGGIFVTDRDILNPSRNENFDRVDVVYETLNSPIPAGVKPERDNWRTKIFVWDSFDGMKPYAEPSVVVK